ncbi:mechanosensitive ion channel family protein [Massilia sp. S19_KUP03_FR1]|uniref:mechanosensitive ion channel family protein n=1 Tax=Massilia sp. S19_KUP03_FR1 TaxID=3025503 RepID=UPI002FCD7371
MLIVDLLTDLFDDFRNPALLWQALAIAVSIGLGAGASRLAHRYLLAGRAQDTGFRRIGVDSFGRVIGPLMVVGYLALSKVVLLKQHLDIKLLKVAFPIFLSLAAIRLVFYVLRRVFGRRGQLGGAFKTFERIFVFVAWLAVVLYFIGVWDDILAYLDVHTLPIGGKKGTSLATILQAAATVVVMLTVALWAGSAIDERLMHIETMHSSMRVVLARMTRAVLILVAVLLSLQTVGLDLTVLSVFGGALGVGVGLGMQKIASNYVSGFVILLERSLSIGDMITVDKYSGRVSRINSRYTVLQGGDGVETVLPNEMLISSAVQNQSLSSPSVRAATRVTVAHGSDLAVVMPLLAAQVVGVERVLETPAPAVAITRFAPDGYELEIGCWVADAQNGTGGVVNEINRRIYDLIASGQVRLGYPHVDSTLLDAHIALVVSRIVQPDVNSA